MASALVGDYHFLQAWFVISLLLMVFFAILGTIFIFTVMAKLHAIHSLLDRIHNSQLDQRYPKVYTPLDQ